MNPTIRKLLLAMAVIATATAVAQAPVPAPEAGSESSNGTMALAGFQKLAEQGQAEAQFSLGMMYMNGTGVMKDDRQATQWLRRAAIQGHGYAKFYLDLMHSTGRLSGGQAGFRMVAEEGC
jgi:TPR repeat protein